MSNSKNTADRIRPYLQAMEQSIAAARQRRLNKPSQTPVTPKPLPEMSSGMEETRPRLRARPKRPPNYTPGYDNAGSRPSHSGLGGA